MKQLYSLSLDGKNGWASGQSDIDHMCFISADTAIKQTMLNNRKLIFMPILIHIHIRITRMGNQGNIICTQANNSSVTCNKE